MTHDTVHMQLALDLAGRGRYTSDPNPRVGCVIVHSGEVVGTGWHAQAGQPHAEVVALQEAGALARGAVVYVTLEPCCHHGRTPPCSQALIDAGIKEVVYALEDPNPAVAGQGLSALEDAGIGVRQGPLADQARCLNQGFISRMSRGRPYVRAKLAVSLDGKTALASGESQWITGPESRADVHRQRAAASVILTGSGTVLADNPRLSARLTDRDQLVLQPRAVVVDSKLRLPAGAQLFRQGSPLVFTTSRDSQARSRIEAAGGELEVQSTAGPVDLMSLMQRLGARGYNEVWVEAGAGLNGALAVAGLVDEYIIYYAPVLLGSAARDMFDFSIQQLSQRIELKFVEQERLGGDLRIRAVPSSVDRAT